MNSDTAAVVSSLEFWSALAAAAFFVLLFMQRRDRVSLGLPVAYLFLLLLIHLPGACAHIAEPDLLTPTVLTEIGMRFASIGIVCFVCGVWLARASIPAVPIHNIAVNWQFWRFCLIGGWIVSFGLAHWSRIPTLGAAIHQAGGIWILGTGLGLASALERHEPRKVLQWGVAMLVYPVLMLLFGGFLSYGAVATAMVLGVTVVSYRHSWRILALFPVVVFLGMAFFGNYMLHRADLRAVIWSPASLSQRVDVVADMLSDFTLFDLGQPAVLQAVDARLNQNYFVGLAAQRIEDGEAEYWHGQTISDAVLALVPRALWPSKPIKAGSGDIVAKATGLELARNTSWGVGNVMEFQINFGMPGVIIGFAMLGLLMGWLDRQAAMAYAQGDMVQTILLFLPCTALIDPNGSLVEMTSGAGAAVVAAYGWQWLWTNMTAPDPSKALPRESGATVSGDAPR